MGSYIDHLVWASILPDLELDLSDPIYQLWRSMRNDPAQPNPGPPITFPIDTEVGVQQGFSSGMVLGRDDDGGAYVANG